MTDRVRDAARWALQVLEAIDWEDEEPPTAQIDALRDALAETPGTPIRYMNHGGAMVPDPKGKWVLLALPAESTALSTLG